VAWALTAKGTVKSRRNVSNTVIVVFILDTLNADWFLILYACLSMVVMKLPSKIVLFHIMVYASQINLSCLVGPVNGADLSFLFYNPLELVPERAWIFQVAWRSFENARGQNNLFCSSLFHLRCPREYLFAWASAAAVDTDDFHGSNF